MTIKTILQAFNTLNSEEFKKIYFKGTEAYEIITLTNKLYTIVESFNKTKNKMIEQYGEKNEKGVFHITPENLNFNVYLKELNELLEQECKEEFPTLSFEIFADKNISINMLSSLMPFIEQKEQ